MMTVFPVLRTTQGLIVIMSGRVLRVLILRQLVMTIILILLHNPLGVVLILIVHGWLKDHVQMILLVVVIAHTHVKKMRVNIYMWVQILTVTILNVNAKMRYLTKTKILMLHVVPEIQ